jgi:hypothetical protein
MADGNAVWRNAILVAKASYHRRIAGKAAWLSLLSAAVVKVMTTRW